MTAWYDAFPFERMNPCTSNYQELYAEYQQMILDDDTGVHSGLISQSYIDALFDLNSHNDFIKFISTYCTSFKLVITQIQPGFANKSSFEKIINIYWNLLNSPNITSVLDLNPDRIDLPGTIKDLARLQQYLNNSSSIPHPSILSFIQRQPQIYTELSAAWLKCEKRSEIPATFTSTLIAKTILNHELHYLTPDSFNCAFVNVDLNTLSTTETAHLIQNVFHMSTRAVLSNRTPNKSIIDTMNTYLKPLTAWPHINRQLAVLESIKPLVYLDFDLICGIVGDSITSHPIPTFGLDL